MQLHGKLSRATKNLDCVADKVGVDKVFCRVLLFFLPVIFPTSLYTHLSLPLRYAICSNSQHVKAISSSQSMFCV
jgi:hypothetical protein